MNKTIRELTVATKGQLILGDPKAVGNGVCIDSRNLQVGQVFFALKGERVDGHDFALSVCRQGAAAVVVSNLSWLKGAEASLTAAVVRVAEVPEALRNFGKSFRNGFKGPVVAITGSNGKTTTKQMVASILKTTGPGLATKGNYNSQIGLPVVLADLKTDDRWMALEMGDSAPGQISVLADIAQPTVGIVTSIGPEHMQSFGSMKHVVESKWELMEALPTDGSAILPWAEASLQPYIRSYKKKIVFFGEDPACPVRASAIVSGEKMNFLLHISGRSAKVNLALPGRFNVRNALAAAAAGWVLGLPLEKIVEGLEKFEPAKMRMEMTHHSSGAVLLNDAYNANPASMIESVRTLVETYPAKRRIVVMGSMLELGEESEKFHFHVGTEVGRFTLEKVFLVGKETKQITEGAVSVGAPASKFTMMNSSDEVGEALSKLLKPDVVVLFKGSRGMQLEKILEKI
jgi:UDP-N-acetylmuramoyl-tripeptide--D-alanyl-D-alanine ligase